MHLTFARGTLTVLVVGIFSRISPAPKPVVAQIEPPRSVGTPLTEVAKLYTGPGLADKIEGRLRLDTDATLTPGVRRLIRMHLSQDS
ncbi:MAG TPA: hypothetical protein VD930_07355 [Gemmatimonadales bacterium]|nr:hypothetical protein [Gemmatimonadales bacterium]